MTTIEGKRYAIFMRNARQRAYVGGGLQPGAALVVVRLAVVTLPPRSTAPAVAGCRLVGCSVVSGRPMRSRAVAGVSQRVRVGLGPVLAVFWPPVPRLRLLPPRPPGEERLGPSYFFMSFVLGPLHSLLWYVPSSRYIWSSAPIFCFCKNK